MNRRFKQILLILALVISAFFAKDYSLNEGKDKSYSHIPLDKTDLQQVISERLSGEIVLVDAKVIKLLSDDLEGSKHQKMIIKVGTNTLLVAHNIDIAPRVPVKKGEQLLIKGEYEWNDKGGLIHWTHRSNNSHPAGWIKYNNKKYH